MTFIDSNIWLYPLLDTSEHWKRQRAADLCSAQDVCISTQVVNEVLSNFRTKKAAPESEIRRVLEEFYDYQVLEIRKEDIVTASELRDEHRLSYWDSLIIATALRAKAQTLYSEDMQDGLVVRGTLLIRNPFR